MKGLPVKKLGEKVLLVFLFIVVVSPFAYIFHFRPGILFWENAMGNLLATVLALIAGIPVALLIDRAIRRNEEKEKYLTERKREEEILSLIKEELDFSYNSLFLKGKKGYNTSITIQPLKSDLWDSLIAGEETKHIKDPSLLNRIASAYYVLKTIKGIEEQAYVALRTTAIQFTLPMGQKGMPPNYYYQMQGCLTNFLKLASRKL